MSKILGKYSMGIGDRFGCQGVAQLRACFQALEHGVEVIPVWNKSNREHNTIGSEPASTRAAADTAVRAAGWSLPYFLDADHIQLANVERFIAPCDFFTLDVADAIGKPASTEDIRAFVARHPELEGDVAQIAGKYLLAIQRAGEIYHRVAQVKGEGTFITEVSMDETDAPQTPPELLIILAAIADEGIPAQTIAPKFTGRFNKGVDYVGDVEQFAREFNADLDVIAQAVARYDLPANLKLSVHSGSDKFSIYPAIREALQRTGAGLHLKTAGTTWLEEVIGLAEADGDGLALAKKIYAQALAHREELSAPYATVIDIDAAQLPSAETVNRWSATQFVEALRHDPANPAFNPSLRQLLHVGYKIAAGMGAYYLEVLAACEPFVSKNVTENLYTRHLQSIFIVA